MIDKLFLIYCVTMGMMCDMPQHVSIYGNISSNATQMFNTTVAPDAHWINATTIGVITNITAGPALKWCNGTVMDLIRSGCEQVYQSPQYNWEIIKSGRCPYLINTTCCQGTECGARFWIYGNKVKK